MKITADILDANDNPVATLTEIINVSVSRELDGPGRMSFSVPCAAAGADSLVIKRRARLMLEYLGITRELGTMILDNVSDRDSAGQWTRNCTGSDILTELKYTSTLLGRSYQAKQANFIASALIALASGWSISVETLAGEWETSIRYDGDTVLRALQILAETGGYHIRRGDSGKTVEFGAFGEETDVLICNPGQFVTGDHDPQTTGYITSITMERVGEPIATRLYPFGAGSSGDSVLTLAESTRTTPYAISSETVNGRLHYSLTDAAAAAVYGTIVRVEKYTNLAPLSNTVADITAASNALYDAAAARLAQYSTAQETLRVSVTGLNAALKPGDKVRLTYLGRIKTESNDEYVARDYDDYFYVISVNERISTSGISTELELSNVDQRIKDEAETIVGGLEEVRLQGIRVQPSFAPLPFQFQDSLDPTHDLTVIVPVIDDATYMLQRALLYLRTTPFRVNARAETSSTAHGHMILRSSDGTSAGAMATRRFTIMEQTTETLFHFDASSDVGASARFFDTAPGGGHTHTLDYGVYDDTDYPDHISLKVNGSTVATGLDASGVGLNSSYNITDYLQPPTAAALRQNHTILLECTGGQGTIYGLLLLWIQALPFKLS